MANKYYIATSIPYVNAKPHIGHTLDVLYGDVLARHYRSLGYDVILQAGVDENGQKLYQKACEQKKTVEEWISELRPVFVDFFKKLEISYDVFTQTSDAKHHAAAQELWTRAVSKGDIYKKKYSGLYCVGCESFKIEDDLVDGKCPDHQTVPEKIEEENYFFALSKYENYLKELFENTDFVYPNNSYKEALSMLEGGLEDVSVSRPKARLPWGVPVPKDPDHVMYVWFDALTNYLTALGFPDDEKKMKKFWPPDMEIVGKDNNRWHTLLWPAMLKSGDLEPPKKVLVHSHILGKGGIKMSKTIGNVVDPVEVMDKYSGDVLRYFLLSKIPMDSDGAIDLEHLDVVYNTELANDLGNLLQRTLVMATKYGLEPRDYKVDIMPGVIKDMDNLRFGSALEKIWQLIRETNSLIEHEKPWELAKNDEKKLFEVLDKLLTNLSVVAISLEPFMPQTAQNIKEQLISRKPEVLFPRIEA
jgi:methionyl-tRNA synthetase